MKLRFVAIVLIASVASYANAQQSTVYLCTDAKGNKEYTNTPTSKGCKKNGIAWANYHADAEKDLGKWH